MAFLSATNANQPTSSPTDYKGNDYQRFDKYGESGVNAINNLSDFGKNALTGSPDMIDHIMQNYKMDDTTADMMKRQLVRNDNSASAGGYAGSSSANYQNASDIANISNAGRDRYLQNNLALMGMGQNATNSVANMGLDATRSSLGGLQADERLAFEKQQYEDAKKAQEENSGFGGFIKGLGGLAVKTGLNAVMPGLGTVAGGWVNDKLGLRQDIGGGLVKKADYGKSFKDTFDLMKGVIK